MAIITESQLKSHQRSKKVYALSESQSLRNFRNESSLNKTKIFLSHKHDESEMLEGAISFLNDLGVDVYVDWQDEGMPKSTSGQTAARIKQKIKENHKFIFLATDGAINSKWCNWELGLGDAAKYIEHIAIFPVKKDYTDFTGNEYFQIYPYLYTTYSMEFFKGEYRTQGTYVVYPTLNGNDRVIPISQWLRNK